MYENKKIFACRDKILNNHSLTQVKREILLQQPAYFDLMKVADGSLETLRNVHNSLMNFVINANTMATIGGINVHIPNLSAFTAAGSTSAANATVVEKINTNIVSNKTLKLLFFTFISPLINFKSE